MQVETWKLDRIRVEDRLRQDLGDLSDLKKSMTERGLIHPLTVESSGRLVTGERRLRAAEALGWLDIDVRVWRPADAAELLALEGEENICRKALTPGEAEMYWQRLKALMAPDAAVRRARKGMKRNEPYPVESQPDEPSPDTEASRARARAAKATGYNQSTLAAVAKVRKIAQDPNQPPKVQEEAERQYTYLMEGTTKVRTALKKVEAVQRAEGVPPSKQGVPLSPEEINKIQDLVAEGKNNMQIADLFGCSEWTVRKYRDAPSVAPVAPSSIAKINAKQQARKEQRIEKIGELAAEGYSSRDIAGMVGIREDLVRKHARDNGIEIRADVIMLGTRRTANADHIIQATIDTLRGFTTGHELIKWDEVSAKDIPDWLEVLKEAKKEITQFSIRLAKRLKESEPIEPAEEV